MNVRISWKEREARAHLSNDTATGPHVDLASVLLRAQKELRTSIPPSHHLEGVGAHWNKKSTIQSQISDLEHRVSYQYILRLQVAVHPTTGMHVRHAAAELPRVDADVVASHAVLDDMSQIGLAVRHDYRDVVLFDADIVDRYDVWMIQLLQCAYFAQRRSRNSFVVDFILDSLYSDYNARGVVSSSSYKPECTLAELLVQCIVAEGHFFSTEAKNRPKKNRHIKNFVIWLQLSGYVQERTK